MAEATESLSDDLLPLCWLKKLSVFVDMQGLFFSFIWGFLLDVVEILCMCCDVDET